MRIVAYAFLNLITLLRFIIENIDKYPEISRFDSNTEKKIIIDKTIK